MKTFQEHWIEILGNFDWDKVRKIMELLDWKWVDHNSESVPSIGRIIMRAEELCRNAYESKAVHQAGGFWAEYEEDTLTLKFVLEEWYTEDEGVEE